jgi:hypothetical protein
MTSSLKAFFISGKFYLIKIKDKLLSFYDYLDYFINSYINKIKFRIYSILFGNPLGTYEFDEETGNNYLKYPIIILNNELLLELEEYSSSRLQCFCDEVFGDWRNNSWTWSEKEMIFEEKLKELLKGKFFPVESPVCDQDIKYQLRPREFSFSYDLSYDLMFRQTVLPEDFTLKLYEEWQKDPEFLTYVICKYLGYYVFEQLQINTEFDFKALMFMKDSSIFNNYATLDLTPFFLFKEQIDTVVNDLEKNFQYEIKNYKKHWHYKWVCIFIKNLKEKGNSFPSEKNQKIYKKIGFIILIISPILPIIISIIYDILYIIILYNIKYYYLLPLFILYILYNNKFNLINIFIKLIEFIRSQYKMLFLTYISTLVCPYFKFFIKRLPFYKTIFQMYPILISTKDRNLQSILKERQLQNSLKLILLGKYTQDLDILRKNRNIFSNVEKTKLNIGKSIHSIRIENPRLVNHKFLKDYRLVFTNLNSSYNGDLPENLILLNQIKEVYRMSITTFI